MQGMLDLVPRSLNKSGSCELLNPMNIGPLQKTVEMRLSGLPFVKAALVKELPRYIQVARTADITPYNLTDWCRQHADKIPAWSELQAIGALLQPTSGGAERVFALASTQVDELQASGPEDMISLSVMLQYNERLKTNRRLPRESPPSGSFAQALRALPY